ncbi:MAG: hypothetical protein B7Y56_03205 [Gallionellales bacterium 35-53-114]|nr:MAG: hypothetical protein B7Y56_03205 [Gallionellales bacterium 35-53-114]OYZ65114.1 MAG: hypothetical protein B7Y04_00365 [Gallionellales bacterium 24-53-125]OZB08022.1 MAG: hypothetical protein B7X61_10815 [Gallionellales bacterium 39-52-133]
MKSFAPCAANIGQLIPSFSSLLAREAMVSQIRAKRATSNEDSLKAVAQLATRLGPTQREDADDETHGSDAISDTGFKKSINGT